MHVLVFWGSSLSVKPSKTITEKGLPSLKELVNAAVYHISVVLM